MEIVDRCRFSLEELAYQYHEEALIPGMTAQQSLEHYTWEGIKAVIPKVFRRMSKKQFATNWLCSRR
ncbi:DNA polymerase III alpha subunit [Rhizobium mongolense]